DIELHVDRRLRCERAVDLFRRGCGEDEPRRGLDGHVEREAIAACDSACGIDDDSLELARRPPRATYAQRAFLAHAQTPRHPGARAACERDAPPGPFPPKRASHIGYGVSHVSASVLIAA